MQVVSLGSRKNLCLKAKLRAYISLSRINEECKELVDDKKCEFYKQQEDLFMSRLSMKPLDIEDLYETGKKTGCCAYYGSREFFAQAELVLLPYNLLLHKASRESLSLDLKDSVVIIDEAHNLIDSLNSIHSCSVNVQQIEMAHGSLEKYIEKYTNRLKGQNLVYCHQLLKFLCNLKKFLWVDRICDVNEFLFASNLDSLNMFKLEEFITESKISYKVSFSANFRLFNLWRKKQMRMKGPLLLVYSQYVL